MNNIFITEIKINKVRNIQDFKIPLSSSDRKHLIITGKNGSGKTSLLEELRDSLNSFYPDVVISKPFFGDKRLNIETIFNDNSLKPIISEGKFVMAYFDSKRKSQFKRPDGIKKIPFKNTYHLSEQIASEFIQYIVNLRADRSFARDENEIDIVNEVDKWFSKLEENLAKLFNDPSLKLSFDRKNYNFNLIEEGRNPYNLNQLSDGYSAVLNIITELLLRMDNSKTKSYDVQGIVLIDELETHLHVDLQKKVLPFLINFFPKLQFIVTTHSPFVINSIENAVVCDLEKRIVTEDLSGYSYDTLIESYFGADKYSLVLKNKIDEYERLILKESLDENEKIQLQELKRYIDDTPKFLADELAVKIQQIQLKHLNNKKSK